MTEAWRNVASYSTTDKNASNAMCFATANFVEWHYYQNEIIGYLDGVQRALDSPPDKDISLRRPLETLQGNDEIVEVLGAYISVLPDSPYHELRV